MDTSKLTKSLTSIVIFQYGIVKWWKLEVHTISRPSDIHTGYKQEILQRERVKYDPHDMAKQKKVKIAQLFLDIYPYMQNVPFLKQEKC